MNWSYMYLTGILTIFAEQKSVKQNCLLYDSLSSMELGLRVMYNVAQKSHSKPPLRNDFTSSLSFVPLFSPGNFRCTDTSTKSSSLALKQPRKGLREKVRPFLPFLETCKRLESESVTSSDVFHRKPLYSTPWRFQQWEGKNIRSTKC